MSKRILGDLRIFQSVYADIHHQLEHDPDNGAYLYNKDPFEFEDDMFPKTVEAINKYAETVVEQRIKEIHQYYESMKPAREL